MSQYGLYFANHTSVLDGNEGSVTTEEINKQTESAWQRLLDDEKVLMDGMHVKGLVLREHRQASEVDPAVHWTFDAYDAKTQLLGFVHVYEDAKKPLQIFLRTTTSEKKD
ncbi:hypothetical protein VNI00_009033 [Paramarasmius palmivorus]|uniref:Uncharacterized protein n=1 Tax=Paramarasmius palmivorus TaxID=297713 RepID=A0AAW0CP26_9AGAR